MRNISYDYKEKLLKTLVKDINCLLLLKIYPILSSADIVQYLSGDN